MPNRASGTIGTCAKSSLTAKEVGKATMGRESPGIADSLKTCCFPGAPVAWHTPSTFLPSCDTNVASRNSDIAKREPEAHGGARDNDDDDANYGMKHRP